MNTTIRLFFFFLILIQGAALAQTRQSELAIQEQIFEAGKLKNTDPEKGFELLTDLEKNIDSYSDTLKIIFYIEKSFLIQDGLARFSESVEAIKRADDLSSQNENFKKGEINMEWGQMYAYNGDFDQAKEKYRIAIESFTQSGQDGMVIQARDRLGNTYYYGAVSQSEPDTLQLDSAKMLFAYNLKVVEANKDTISMGPVYSNYAMIFGTYEEYDSALYYYNKALQADIAKNDSTGMAVVYANMAINSEGDTAMVTYYENKAFEIAELLNAKRYLMDFYRYFAEEAARNGYFEKALNYQLAYNELENELLNQDLQGQIKDWEITQENEAQARKIEDQNVRTRNILIFAAIVVCFLIFIAVVNRRLTKVKAQLQIQNEELEQLNATKDKFFSIIAHDLRSPMIGLQGVGQKLDYFIKKKKQEKLLELGGQIDQSIDQLNHLLNNLLNWAAAETGGIPHHPKLINLKSLVVENIELYKSLAKAKGIALVDQTSDNEVYADLNSTSTIIRNLLSNAIKFSPENGKVFISDWQEGDQLGIAIKDQGKGLDESQIAQIKTGTTNSQLGSKNEKGFGLGLKLCQEFAAQNNGLIDIKSELNEGCTFALILPKRALGMVRKMNVA